MYIVLEIQKFSESSIAVPTPIYTNEDANQAESEFHRLCSIAAISSVPYHSVMLIEDTGCVRDMKGYYHG